MVRAKLLGTDPEEWNGGMYVVCAYDEPVVFKTKFRVCFNFEEISI